jgi:quinol-cytochrome oxidoreductase complex cytochrome b subunit
MRPSFFNHLHPPTIPAEQSRWRYTLGAGGIGVFLLLVVAASGILEMFYYIPTPDQAAASVQTISYLVPLGGFVRNLHFWSAYAPPRRFNYLLGLGLFVLSILLDFTGYVLRWDQGVQWALVVGTNLLKTVPAIGDTLFVLVTGGSQLGAATLIRFYAWHIFGLTLGAIVLGIWHIFRVRRDGGIAVPPVALRKDKTRITRAELASREVAAMLYVGAALILLSAFEPAPIGHAITDIGAISGEVRAPWFFLWVQQILKWGDPFVWGILVPLVLLGIVAVIPYVLPRPAAGELGRWFPKSGRAAQALLAAIAVALLVLTVLGRYTTP